MGEFGWPDTTDTHHCSPWLAVYGQPGSPENTPLDGILVDVLRWNVSFVPGQYPTVRFAYYPDGVPPKKIFGVLMVRCA